MSAYKTSSNNKKKSAANKMSNHKTSVNAMSTHKNVKDLIKLIYVLFRAGPTYFVRCVPRHCGVYLTIFAYATLTRWRFNANCDAGAQL